MISTDSDFYLVRRGESGPKSRMWLCDSLPLRCREFIHEHGIPNVSILSEERLTDEQFIAAMTRAIDRLIARTNAIGQKYIPSETVHVTL